MKKEQVIEELKILEQAMAEEFNIVPTCLGEAIRLLKDETTDE